MKILKTALVCLLLAITLAGCNNEHNHEWINGTITKQPTQTEYGEMMFSCKFCDATNKEIIDKLPHEHIFGSEWEKNKIKHWHTCTVENCTSVRDSEAHTWDEGVVVQQSTPSSQGRKLYTCTVCGENSELAYVASFKIEEEQLYKAITQGAFSKVNISYENGANTLDISVSDGVVKYCIDGTNIEEADSTSSYGSYAIAEKLSVLLGKYSSLSYDQSFKTYVYTDGDLVIGLQFADGALVFASFKTSTGTEKYTFSY